MAKSPHIPFGKSALLRLLMAVTLAAGISGFAFAAPLSPEEALSRLKGSTLAKASPSGGLRLGADFDLVRSISLEPSEEPALYLFSQSAARVLVVSANDCAPALLGYFDNPDGMAPGASLPENLEYWLREYAAQIQYAEENPGSMQAPSLDSSRPAIDYLVKTKWNQGDPFNLECPVFSGSRSVTGCVATAFAQVMNYHRWPERGRGAHSYSVTYSNYGTVEFSIDFSEIEFDWDAMLDEYDSNSSERSKEAVAMLMKACGYSVDMQYTPYSSGAVTNLIVTAAPEYFDYSTNAYFAYREYYSSPEWESLVYGQLSKGLPLIYSGRDGTWANSSGHCFVCDGYDGNGYFHFNWGWGGYCDGYFLMSALVPQGVGIGGAADGYNYAQGCIVNFHPSSESIEPSVSYYGEMLRIYNDTHLYTNAIPEPVALAKPEMDFAIEFTSENSGETFLMELGSFSLSQYDAYHPQRTLTYSALESLGMADGNYVARFLYDNDGEWHPLQYPTYSPSSATVTLADSKVELRVPEVPSQVKVTDVKFNGSSTIISGAENELSYTATNDSDEPVYWVSLHYLVPAGQAPGDAGTSIYNTNLILAPNESRTISLRIPSEKTSSLANGEYYVAIQAGIDLYSTSFIYSDESVTFRISDGNDALSDGTFVYQELGNGSVALTGTADGLGKLGGDVVLPDMVTLNGTEYSVSSLACSLSDILDIENLTSLDIRTPIASIPNYQFRNASTLRSIAFPPTLKAIGECAFDGCSGLTGNLILPEGLASIGNAAFQGCSGFTGNLILPEGLASIGIYAFNGCSGFDGNLILPEGLASIGYATFAYCSGLTGNLILPEGLASIGGCAFEGCSGLTGNLILPEGLTSIGGCAFWGCSGFDGNLILPEGLASIEVSAFYACSGFTGNLRLPEGLSSIGGHAFRACSGFDGNLILPEGLSSIEDYAFWGCNGFTGNLILPDGVASIGECAFGGCSGFDGNLILPEGLASIGERAFDGCSGFTGNLILSEGLSSIGEWAFRACSGFDGNLILPEGLSSIGNSAFSGCSGFTGNLRLPAGLSSIGVCAFWGCSGFTGNLILPEGLSSIGTWTFRDCSGFDGNLILPEGLSSIGAAAFRDCSGFTGNLILPEGLSSIGESAFYGCSGFDGNLILPEGLSSIGDWAFYGCSGFTGNLILPEGLSSIGKYAFAYCSGFDGNLILPEGLASIGASAFCECSGFTGTLRLPEGLTSIGANAFYRCSGFTGTLLLPEGLTSIEEDAFFDCSGFDGNLRLPEGLTSIGKSAFRYCRGFTGNLILPEGLSSIGEWAFDGCRGFTGNLRLPEGLSSIGAWAFWGCSGFTGNLILPEGLTSIGKSAFEYCRGLTGNLRLPEGLSSIGDWAFYGCSGFTGNLILPAGLSSIGEYAFNGCNGFTGNLILPEGLSSIGKYAFYECYGLTGIKMLQPDVPEVGERAFPNRTICVPITAGDAYRSGIPEYSDWIFELADANKSGSVTVSDAVAAANDAIGLPNAEFARICADMNSDDRISIVDATAIVDAVMKHNPDGGSDAHSAAHAPAAELHGRIVADNILPDSRGEACVGLRLDAEESLVALQADVTVGDGLAIDGIALSPALSETHSLEWRSIGNNRIRLAVFSMGNAAMPSGEAIINVTLRCSAGCDGDLTLSSIIGATADARDIRLGYVGGTNLGTSGISAAETGNSTVSASDGVLSIANAEGMEVSVYDASGKLVMRFASDSADCRRALQPGIYLVAVGNCAPVKIRI